MSAASAVGDPIVGVAGFTHALALAGLPITSDAVEAFTRALRQVDVADPHRCTGRVARPVPQPRRHSALRPVFESWFGGTVLTGIPQHGPQPRRARIAALDATGGTGAAGDAPRFRVAADDTEILRHRDIAELTAAERAHLAELIDSLRPRPPKRPALRRRASRRGSVDPRARCGTCSPRAANRCGRGTTARPPGRAGWCCCSTCPAR